MRTARGATDLAARSTLAIHPVDSAPGFTPCLVGVPRGRMLEKPDAGRCSSPPQWRRSPPACGTRSRGGSRDSKRDRSSRQQRLEQSVASSLGNRRESGVMKALCPPFCPHRGCGGRCFVCRHRWNYDCWYSGGLRRYGRRLRWGCCRLEWRESGPRGSRRLDCGGRVRHHRRDSGARLRRVALRLNRRRVGRRFRRWGNSVSTEW